MNSIFNNLNLLSISKDKKIDLSNISYNLRKNIFMLNSNFSCEGFGQDLNIILSDIEIIDFINKLNIPSSYIKFLLKSTSNNYNNNADFIKLLKEILKIEDFLLFIEIIYDLLKNSKAFDKRGTLICNIIKHLDKHKIYNDKRFPNMLVLYFEINNESNLKKYPILQSFNEEYKLRGCFSTFVIERIYHNISINCILDKMQNVDIKDFDNLDFLMDYFNDIKIAHLVSTLYLKLEDFEQKEQFILNLKNIDINKKTIIISYLLELSEKIKSLSLLEFNTILSIIEKDLIVNDIFNFIYSENPILFNDNLKDYHIDFIKDNLKKKNFLKLIENNIEIFSNLLENNILFHPKFVKIINLNNLNKNYLDILLKSSISTNKYFILNDKNILYLDETKELTFNEFIYLINKDNLTIQLFYKLYDLNIKINIRLKLLKELPDLSKYFKERNIRNEDINLVLSKLSLILSETSFKDKIHYLKDKYDNLSKIKDEDFLFIIINYEDLFDYLKDIKQIKDAYYIFDNLEELRLKNINLYNFKIEKMKNNYYYNFLIEELELTNEFINENIDRIFEFCEKNLHEVFFYFMNNKHQEDLQRENMKKLVKAELLNKLKELKFIDIDFDLEIGLKVPQNIKDEWKNNLSYSSNNTTLKETYDFNDIIRLGEIPVDTCQHWNGGIYSKSLLSNFDTNKKMITNSIDNIVNTRALIRLTKGTFDEIKKTLSFKNIEEQDLNIPVNEEIILFLERTYSNLDKSQLILVQKEIINLAKEKAKLLNIPLVISSFYMDALKSQKLIEYNLFISYSKNGSQYLDSLGGQADSFNEGSYCNCYVYYIE